MLTVRNRWTTTTGAENADPGVRCAGEIVLGASEGVSVADGSPIGRVYAFMVVKQRGIVGPQKGARLTGDTRGVYLESVQANASRERREETHIDDDELLLLDTWYAGKFTTGEPPVLKVLSPLAPAEALEESARGWLRALRLLQSRYSASTLSCMERRKAMLEWVAESGEVFLGGTEVDIEELAEAYLVNAPGSSRGPSWALAFLWRFA